MTTDNQALGLLERAKSHWLGAITLVLVASAGATWYVAEEVLVAPRDFAIDRLNDRLQELKTSNSKLTGELHDLRDAPVLGGLAAEFLPSRVLAYQRAKEMFEGIAQNPEASERILNLRATKWVPDQDSLYKTIFGEMGRVKFSVMYRRIITSESDPELTVVREFLSNLGENRNVELIITSGSPTVPSCFITDSAALLGFNGPDGRLIHALYVEGPSELVQDLSTIYELIAEDPQRSMVVKGYQESIIEDAIDARIEKTRDWLSRRLKQAGPLLPSEAGATSQEHERPESAELDPKRAFGRPSGTDEHHATSQRDGEDGR